jgi:hypothetical protein
MPKKPAVPEDLDGLIEAYAHTQAAASSISRIQELRRGKILALLRRRRKDHHLTPKGTKAQVVTSEMSTWHIDQLKKALDPARFKALCPPAPNGKALKAILVSDPVLGVRLAKCRDVEESISLRVEAKRPEPEEK